MYKHRLKPALEYFGGLANGTRRKISEEEARQEMERLLVQIGFFQHERLVHLIVTVLFGLATVITVPAYLMLQELSLLVLGGLFLVLLVPYIVHYFHLENGVQQLYLYYNQLEIRANPGYKKIY